MVLIHNADTFTVRLVTLIAEYDRDTMVNLYQPLIGHEAVSLYFTLWSEANNQKIIPTAAHESLFVKTQFTVGEFIKARKALEAVGLLKTYLETTNESRFFHYELYAPKTPNDFFNDTLLYGLLIKCIGEKEAQRAKNLYSIMEKNKVGEDISASFQEVFHPDFEDPVFMKAIKSSKSVGRNQAKIDTKFSYEKLFEELAKVGQISENALLKKDLREIARLATLYGIDEPTAASVINSFYNPAAEKGKRLDLENITKAFQEETNFAYLSSSKSISTKPKFVSSSGALASKINLMESISPKDFLAILQNGTEPATPDLKLIDSISKKFRLNNSVINAVIDYVLTTNNNVLSRPYCEKVAASLAREGIVSTLDAMNYLKKISSGNKERSNQTKENEYFSQSESKPKSKEENLNWNQLVDDIDIGEDGGDENGKA